MSIYHFSANSPVSDITFRYANDRPPVGLISAAGGISADEMSTIRLALELQKWQAVPVHIEGKDVLQVSGFQDEGQLAAFLKIHHFVYGNPTITAEPGDHPTRTWQEWVDAVSLKGAGWLNLVGDITLLMAGAKEASAGVPGAKDVLAGGALYTAGAGVLARYGNVRTEHHVNRVLEETADFLKQEAGKLPQDCGLFSILKDKRDGALHKTESILYRHPADVMLGAYTLGAMAMLKAGIKKGNPYGIAYGANSLVVKAASFLIPEKKKTGEEKPATSPVGKLFDWIQEKPMRVIGYGSMISDTLLGLSAYRDYRKNPKQRSYILTFITTATYLMADVLMAMSHKDHTNGEGKFDEDEQRRIVALVAETIARQPENMQAPLADHVAGFLATRPEMKGTAAEIGQSIKEQAAHMQQNLWACRTAALPCAPWAQGIM